MNRAFVTTEKKWARHWRIGVAVGILLGAAIASVVWHFATQPPVAVIDERIEKACGTWPRYEGEALTVVVVGGKLVCWNMGVNR